MRGFRIPISVSFLPAGSVNASKSERGIRRGRMPALLSGALLPLGVRIDGETVDRVDPFRRQ